MNEKNNLNPLDWFEILERLASFATSEQARAQLLNSGPLASAALAQTHFTEISEAQNIIALGERPFMESLDHYAQWYQRLKRSAVLQTLELKDLRKFCLETVALTELLSDKSGVWVNRIKTQLMDAEPPLSAIDQIMSPGGEIRTDASEALHNLHREKTQQTKQLQSTLDRLVHDHQMENVLQEKYVTTREGRWVLPVRGGMQHVFPGIIHSASQSRQTVFMEPEEVIPLNNRLRQIDVDIEAEIERILTQLSHYLEGLIHQFETTHAALIQADVRLAQAKLADALGASECEFSNSRLHLINAYHPLLALKSDKVVKNDILLDEQRRILLLSGPNAGGKTVLLKSVGLAAHMARCGLKICADPDSKIPFFKIVQVAVGDAQSVGESLSTFAAHLTILNRATQLSGSDHLLLIDEICGSTDPEEGSALARSFIQTYSDNKIFSVITSHLGPLKTGWTEHSGVVNGSLDYDTVSGQPLYRFLLGVPGQSLALQTAARVGVAKSILDRAVQFLSPEAKKRHTQLAEIESLKDDLGRLRSELQAETTSARDKKNKYLELISKFRQERDQWLERTVKKAEQKIDALIGTSQVDDIFKRHSKLGQIKSALPEVIRSTGQVTRRKIETVEEFERVYPPGALVFIPSISQDGTIQGKANGKGEVPVLSNSMRLMIHWEQLRPAQAMTNPTSQIIRRSSGVSVSLRDSERTIDVRGQRVDEAISNIEMQLDAAALGGEDRVKIIHGHGTDTLKKAVRSHLSRSIYVKKWKVAGSDGGGDGVTWAELKE